MKKKIISHYKINPKVELMHLYVMCAKESKSAFIIPKTKESKMGRSLCVFLPDQVTCKNVHVFTKAAKLAHQHHHDQNYGNFLFLKLHFISLF